MPAEAPAFASEQAKERYVRRLILDFAFFITELFKLHPEYAQIGEMEADICRWVADSSNPLRGALAPRSVGKTHFGSAGYAAWRLLRDPDTKILIVSKSKIPQARDTVRLIRGWLRTVWFLRHLDPSLNENDGATDQTFQFDVAGSSESKTPSVLAQGIDGAITGSRAHLVIGDDIETDDNTKTVDARQALDQKVNELFNIATFGEKEVVYFGTFWHEQSVYLKLAERHFKFRTWPFTYPLAGEKFLGLAPIIEERLKAGATPGTPTFDHRYGQDEVIRRQSQGRTNWLMQHQLVCNLASTNRYPLKLADLIVFPVQRDKAPVTIAWGTSNDRGGPTAIEMPIVGWEGDRLHAPIMFDQTWTAYTGTKAWIDPAGRGEDRTGLAIVSHLAGMLYVKGVYGLPGGASSESMDRIVELLKRHGVRDCYVETNIDAFDLYFPLLESAVRKASVPAGVDLAYPEGWHCSLEKRHSTGQKELRIIAALEPVSSDHRLVVHPDALRPDPAEPAHQELQFQFSHLTKERKSLKEDGKLDALAGCVSEWMDSLRLNPAKAAEVSRDRYMADLLKEHRRLTGQKPLRAPTWQQPV